MNYKSTANTDREGGESTGTLRTVVAVLLAVAAFIMLAHNLPPVDFGLYVLTILYLVVPVRIVTISLSTGVREMTINQGIKGSGFFGTMLILGLIFGALLTGIAYLYVTHRFDSIATGSNSAIWKMAAVSIIPLVLFEFTRGFSGRLEFRNRPDALVLVGLSLHLVGIALVWRYARISPESAVGIFVLSLSIVSFATCLTACRRDPGVFSLEANLAWRALGKSVLPHLRKMPYFVFLVWELIIIVLFFNLSELGRYAIAFCIAGLAATVLFGFINFVRRYTASHKAANVWSLGDSTRLTIISGIAAVILFSFAGWFFFRNIAGGAYFASYTIFLVLLPGILFRNMNYLFGRDGAPYVKPVNMNWAIPIALTAQFGLSLWLIPGYHATGVAAAHTITQILMTGTLIGVYILRSGGSIKNLVWGTGKLGRTEGLARDEAPIAENVDSHVPR